MFRQSTSKVKKVVLNCFELQSAESYLYLFWSAASDLLEELGICFVLFYLGLYLRISISRKPA